MERRKKKLESKKKRISRPKFRREKLELKKKGYKIKGLFLNMLLKNGKKGCSEIILKKTLINLKRRKLKNPTFVLCKAVDKLLPKIKSISVPNQKRRKKRKRRDRHFIMLLEEKKQIRKSISWLLSSTKRNQLSREIIYILQGNRNCETLKKKKQYYRDIKKLQYNFIF